MVPSEVARVIAVMLGLSLVGMGWLLWRDPHAFLHTFLIPMVGLYAAIGVAVLTVKTVIKMCRRVRWRKRSTVGESTRADAIDLIFDRWGPFRRYSWDETNGRVPYAEARIVRYAIGEPPLLSPTVVTRWVYSKEDPNLLSRLVQAGFNSAEIAAYMTGNEEQRATTRFLLALTADTKTR